MRILYGVVGEGMGHAMRSRVVLDHLTRQGHDVGIMASSRAADYLARRFDGVQRIHGFHIVTEENRVRRGKTLWSNILAGAAAMPQQIRAYFDLVEKFEPQLVISDFESWTYLYAQRHRLPLLSIDNMQVINRCTHAPEILAGESSSFELTRAFVKSKMPGADHYFITAFFEAPIRKERTTLHPPILRPEILAAQPRTGDHLLVYQTAEGNTALTDALAATGLPCRIYGMRRSLIADQTEGNLTHRPFSETVFIDDLASARAVIASAGFTLMGEAVYLHKPMLAVPLSGQFEQILNARYLEREGFGQEAKILNDATIRSFVDALPACEAALARYHQDGNNDLLGAVDREIAVHAAAK